MTSTLYFDTADYAVYRRHGSFRRAKHRIRRYGAGPPFPVARHEVRRLFTPPFRFERELTPVRSVRRRQGQEWMVLARKTRAAS